MSKKAIQKYLLYGELVCVLLMSCFFAYRILTFSNSEPMGYLLARLICFVFALLIFLQNIKSKVTIWSPTFLAVSYVLIVTFNILIVTKTSINDFTDAALWPLLFLTAYEVTAQNCISEVSLFRILKITKIVCLGYSFVLVIEHILGIIPGTSEMFPTYVLLALVPFSLYEMDMEHGIKFNVIYLICTFLIMLMTSKRSCILVLAVGIMGYFLVKAKVQGRNVKAIVNRIAKYIIAIFAIFLAMYFVTKLMKLDIVERLNEMLNGDTNGRSAIWENVLEAFNASTLSEKLIGHGYHAFRFYKYSGYMYILNGNLAHTVYWKSTFRSGGATAYIKKKLASSDPLMICRLGAEESRTAVRWMKNVPYEQRNIHNIMYNAGVFPNDKETIDEFCKIYTGALKDADGVFSWGCKGECSLIKKYASPNVALLNNAVNNILFYDDVWTTALEGKKVLVIHPFVDTIKKQYEKRDKLFENSKLPTFESLECVRAIQSNAGENETIEFSSYFDALESMKAEILKKDFQVALIAAGAYGLPLAAYIKGLGKQAIHMASNMQILFGIRGKRWDNWPAWAAHFNEYWVYPSENETPNGKKL